jgi:hypothetical protein
MNRPSRQRANLLEKIASKESRTPGKIGKRVKIWRKWAEAYKAAAEGIAADGGVSGGGAPKV